MPNGPCFDCYYSNFCKITTKTCKSFRTYVRDDPGNGQWYVFFIRRPDKLWKDSFKNDRNELT